MKGIGEFSLTQMPVPTTPMACASFVEKTKSAWATAKPYIVATLNFAFRKPLGLISVCLITYTVLEAVLFAKEASFPAQIALRVITTAALILLVSAGLTYGFLTPLF